MNKQIFISLEDILDLISKKGGKSISLQTGLKIFIEDLKPRVRPDSVKEANSNTSWIINYLNSINITETNQLNITIINKFIDYSKSRNNSNLTINKRIKNLKRMLNRLIELEIIDHNPISNFKPLKTVKKDIQYVDDETASKVLNLAYNKASAFPYIRNFIGLLIMYETGIRLNELINIHNSNIDFNENSIKLVFTKTSYERIVYISEETSKYLQSFINKNKLTNSYLMINPKTNEPIDKRDFARYIRNLGKELNISSSISPHKWRHGFATTSLMNGADIFYIKEILGHTSLQTTQIYLHSSKDFLMEQHKKNDKFSKLNLKL